LPFSRVKTRCVASVWIPSGTNHRMNDASVFSPTAPTSSASIVSESGGRRSSLKTRLFGRFFVRYRSHIIIVNTLICQAPLFSLPFSRVPETNEYRGAGYFSLGLIGVGKEETFRLFLKNVVCRYFTNGYFTNGTSRMVRLS